MLCSTCWCCFKFLTCFLVWTCRDSLNLLILKYHFALKVHKEHIIPSLIPIPKISRYSKKKFCLRKLGHVSWACLSNCFCVELLEQIVSNCLYYLMHMKSNSTGWNWPWRTWGSDAIHSPKWLQDEECALINSLCGQSISS